MSTKSESAPRCDVLTPRQREVLELVAKGRTNRQIADALGIGLDGAKWHVSEIISRLEVQSREEAAEVWRAEHGLRMRFTRALRLLFSPSLGKLAAAGSVAAIAIGVGLAAGVFSQDQPPNVSPAAQSSPTTRNCQPANLNDERLPIAIGFSYLDATHVWALAMNGEQAHGVGCIVVQFSSDGGETWAKLPTPDITRDFATNITFATANDGWLWGPAQYETHDGGRTWKLTQRGQVLGMWPSGDSVWMLESGGCEGCPPKLWSSNDAGQSWTPLAFPDVGSPLQIHLSRPSVKDAWLVVNGVRNFVFRTQDGARIWQTIAAPESPAHPADIAAIDGTHAWLAAQDSPATAMAAKQVYSTDDGGASWRLVADGMPERADFQNLPLTGNTVHIASPTPGHLFLAMGKNTLYGSFDNGATWKPVIDAPNIGAGDSPGTPVFADAEHGVTSSMSSIYITSDGGATWTALRLAR